MRTAVCVVTGKEKPLSELTRASELPSGLVMFLRAEHPEFENDAFVSTDLLNDYRRRYLQQLLDDEKNQLATFGQKVLENVNKDQLLSAQLEREERQSITTGQRVADSVAKFGGSWTFIICFFVVLLIWMAVNVYILRSQAFDPYPFILLNLVLSCLAAIQAPVIMMSQNRKEEKDRKRAVNDYKVNLKAELEIKILHEKLDYLMSRQNKRLLEIQQLQTDYLAEIAKRLGGNASSES
jgi:uncharacterized membrane protein